MIIKTLKILKLKINKEKTHFYWLCYNIYYLLQNYCKIKNHDCIYVFWTALNTAHKKYT